MSIHHVEIAAELTLPATKKLALMAICDDASKDTRVAYPGLEKIMVWTGVKKRTALALIAELSEEQLVYRLGGGYSGRRTEYLVFPTPEEIESIEAFLQPVDNSTPDGPKKGARFSTHQILKGAEKLRKGAVESTPPVNPPVVTDLEQSIPGATTEQPVDNFRIGDDEVSDPRLGVVGRVRRARAAKHLDVDALVDRVGSVFSDFEQPRFVVHMIALQILGRAVKAGTKLTDPTAYVASSIQAEPEVHRKRAFKLEVSS